MLEVELLTDEALAVPTAFARRYDSCAPAAVLDQRQGGEVELEDAGELVEEHDRDSCLSLHVEQPVRERPRPAEPSFGRWRGLRRVTKSEHGRDRCEQDRRERDQRVARERLPGEEDRDARDCGGQPCSGERQPTLTPECGQTCHADGEVERRDDQQRHRVEQHRLGFCIH